MFFLAQPPRASIPTSANIAAAITYLVRPVRLLIRLFSICPSALILPNPAVTSMLAPMGTYGSRRRPRRIFVGRSTGRQPFQAGTIGVYHIDIPPPIASGTERDVPPVRRPRGRLVVAAAGRQLPPLLAIGADQAELEDSPLVAAHIRDPIPFGGPCGRRIIAPLLVPIGQGSDVRAVRAHEIDLRRAAPV